MKLRHCSKQIEALNAIPAQKRRTKALKTVVGTCVFVGAWFLPSQLGFPHGAAYVVGGFGAWLVSQDLVVTFLRLVPAVIRDIVLALRGTDAPR